MFSMQVVEVGALRDGLLERIEIHHQQVDRADAVRLHRAGVVLVVADREQAAMHLRMQGLDAAVHHLREAGELRHFDDLEPGVGQRLARAAGGDQLDAALGERAGEVDQAGLVGHRDQGAGDTADVFSHDTGALARWMALFNSVRRAVPAVHALVT